jgi:hypothetical protein
MDYADATLVVQGELPRIRSIATIDVNDFSAYRAVHG